MLKPIKKLSRSKILLVIDLQKQFKDDNGNYENCLNFLNRTGSDYYVIATLFQNTPNSMYVNHLQWSDCYEVKDSDIEFLHNKLVRKNGYSSEDVVHILKDNLSKNPNTDIFIMGCDADACVLATAFQLWDAGISFQILSNYIYTTAEEFTKQDVLKILKRNFGDCVI